VTLPELRSACHLVAGVILCIFFCEWAVSAELGDPPEAVALAPAAERPAGTRFRDCDDCPVMIVIPGGTFTMGKKMPADGRREDDPESQRISLPPRIVTIDTPFAVAIYDVTREQYGTFVAEAHYMSMAGCYVWNGDQWAEDKKADWRHPGFQQNSQDPVVCVNWNDAKAYVAWLNGKARQSKAASPSAGRGRYRLLSWAEAEYAAGAGATTAFSWGDDASRDQANYGADACDPCRGAAKGRDRWTHTSPVGSFPPNRFGLYDATGNVWQWAEDCFEKVVADEACDLGVLHGGSWLDSPEYLVVREYSLNSRENRNNVTGFRVARTLN
jgi:formylglycine-generating enzyme required for sulfatase activity